jgi:hypothetical protein
VLFEPIFRALDASGARYVVVGGVAVLLHGHVRATADLDIAIDLAPESAARVVSALVELGLRPRVPVEPSDLADPAIRRTWIEERGMHVFSMVDPGDPFNSVDIFVEEPIGFEELFERSVSIDVGGLAVRVAAIPDLIHLKRLAGRSQDAADIEALTAIADRRAEDEDA